MVTKEISVLKELIVNRRLSEFRPQYLDVIKSIDSDTRESGYQILSEFLSKNDIPQKILHETVEALISDKFLFHGIEEGETNKTVGRSFALLLLGDLLYADYQNSFLDLNNIQQILLSYLDKERDFRGKTSELGWIHTIAHFSDCLRSFAHHKQCSKVLILPISLKLVTKVASLGVFPLVFGEPYRISTALADAETILGDSFHNVLDDLKTGLIAHPPEDHNSWNILYCLFAELKKKKNAHQSVLNRLTDMVFSPDSIFDHCATKVF